jgi:transaldolase
LILAAANKPGYSRLIDAAVKAAKEKGGKPEEQAEYAIDRLVRSCFFLGSHTSIAYINPFIT